MQEENRQEKSQKISQEITSGTIRLVFWLCGLAIVAGAGATVKTYVLEERVKNYKETQDSIHKTVKNIENLLLNHAK